MGRTFWIPGQVRGVHVDVIGAGRVADDRAAGRRTVWTDGIGPRYSQLLFTTDLLYAMADLLQIASMQIFRKWLCIWASTRHDDT